MPESQMTPEAHDLLRAQAARAGYINWRLRDLPALYQNLLPVDFHTKNLWAAECAIRAQYAADLRLENQPRSFGPPCNLLDNTDMTGTELIQFAIEGEGSAGEDDQRVKEIQRRQTELEQHTEQMQQLRAKGASVDDLRAADVAFTRKLHEREQAAKKPKSK